MSKFGRGNLLRLSSETELHGKLQKRNRNGIYQPRYFQTQGSLLKYWTNENEKNLSAGSVFDVREFRSAQNVGDNCLCIQMLNEKFKLELKAVSNEQCNEWADFLRAKMALYSVDNLKSSIDAETLAFKTRTFEGLLRIPVHNQDQWINDLMNDVFLSITDTTSLELTDEVVDTPRQYIQASQKCFEEFAMVCEECELEMSLRDPVVMSNCRDFMHRYSSVFMSRITLELSYYLGREKHLQANSQLSDVFIIECIKFTHSINSIKHYQFLPRSLFIGLRENLQTFDQLVKYLTQLLLDRNEVWFKELDELQPRQRGFKLREFYKIVNFQVEKIHQSFYLSDKNDVDTKTELVKNTIKTMIFSLEKYVKGLDFSNYGEEALLEHMLACQEIVKYCFGLKVHPYYGKINNKSAIENFGGDIKQLSQQWVIALRDHELELLTTSFLTSADEAAASAVKNTFQTFEDIRKMMFYETPGQGWIGGRVCQLYLERITAWVVSFCDRASSTPCEFHRIAIRETIRMVVYSYIKGLCDRYKNDKKFALSEQGCRQLAADLQSITTWVDLQNANLIPPSIKNKSEYGGCNDLTMLLRNIRMFVTSDESSLLICLSESIQHFGSASTLHIYDLARLCLKIRDDVSNSTRKYVLGLFSSYVDQLHRASLEEFGPLSNSHVRLSGPKLLIDLFPNVGVFHCSGKKWSLEKLHDSETDAKLDIVTMVSDACNISRIRRAGMTKESKDVLRKQRSTLKTKRLSAGNDAIAAIMSSEGLRPDGGDDAGTNELWKLMDPSYVDTDGAGSIGRSSSEVTDDGSYHGNNHELGGKSLPFGGIIGMDDGNDEGEDKGDYMLGVERPFVDLHGCTFEELHQTLKPKMYDEVEIPPVVFVNSVLHHPKRSKSFISPMLSKYLPAIYNDFLFSCDSDHDDRTPGNSFSCETDEELMTSFVKDNNEEVLSVVKEVVSIDVEVVVQSLTIQDEIMDTDEESKMFEAMDSGETVTSEILSPEERLLSASEDDNKEKNLLTKSLTTSQESISVDDDTNGLSTEGVELTMISLEKDVGCDLNHHEVIATEEIVQGETLQSPDDSHSTFFSTCGGITSGDPNLNVPAANFSTSSDSHTDTTTAEVPNVSASSSLRNSVLCEEGGETKTRARSGSVAPKKPPKPKRYSHAEGIA